MLGILGILLPVALAMTAYLISSWGDAMANSSPAVVNQRVNQKISEDTGKSKELMEESPKPDDHGDRCAEPDIPVVYPELATDVREGYECGIGIENFGDVHEGDLIEVYEVREVAREL